MKPRRNPRKKPALPARKPLARAAAAPSGMRPDQIQDMRELFWQNIMREMLTALSVAGLQQTESQPAEPGVALFDGRLAIVTRAGERIPIAAVTPLFACGINTPGLRGLSAAVECTVFEFRTPDGHVFTYPLHEIRGFHAMSPELMEKLQASAARRAAQRAANEEAPPFGFGAFTSLARGMTNQPLEPPPSHPTE